jgi:ubiquitin-protein ligase
MSVVRLRRLQSDHQRLTDLINRHPRLQLLRVDGTPPEKYQVEFKIKSLRQKDGELHEVSSHVCEIVLPRDYPRTPPLCRMLTPVFHPNIAPHAVCIGDHWSAGESLPALVTRIGEMLAYQSYNTKSPLNGEAAKWVDQNVARLPLDAVSMHVEDTSPAPVPGLVTAPEPIPSFTMPPPPPFASRAPVAPPPPRMSVPPPPPPPPAPAAAGPTQLVICPGCSAKIRVKAELAGQFRCPRCKTIATVERA